MTIKRKPLLSPFCPNLLLSPPLPLPPPWPPTAPRRRSPPPNSATISTTSPSPSAAASACEPPPFRSPLSNCSAFLSPLFRWLCCSCNRDAWRYWLICEIKLWGWRIGWQEWGIELEWKDGFSFATLSDRNIFRLVDRRCETIGKKYQKLDNSSKLDHIYSLMWKLY